jgi:enhancing lycopene biosynthesis protein 2
MARVGLLLSGCGFYDGTDIHEAVLAMLALERAGAKIDCLAPEGLRGEIVDHSTGQTVEGETRAVLAEAARIARGRVQPVSEARVSLLGALVIPGGFGVARSLVRGFGRPGGGMTLEPSVAALVRSFLDQRKPIGAVSLAGTLPRLVLGMPLDETWVDTPARDIRVDEQNGVVWTPGYLGPGTLPDVEAGITRMVEEVLSRIPRQQTVPA